MVACGERSTGGKTQRGARDAGAKSRDKMDASARNGGEGGISVLDGRCGDGIASPEEACDGEDFGGTTCADVGMHFNEGTLRCTPDCGLDVTGCKRVVPAAWTCAPDKFAGGDNCDCGCGVLDPDCESPNASRCTTCGAYGSCAKDCFSVSNKQNWLCVPKEWTCAPPQFGDGRCDCGCGTLDPDCENPR
jgi:hypothetical protein